MKNTEIIEETAKRIDAILADREKELITLDDQIQAEEASVASAVAEMSKATAAGDLEAYRRAKAEKADALDAKEMHEARKDALKNKPLISETEYEKTVSGIVAAVAAIQGDTKKELTALSDRMAAAAADLADVARFANDTLQRLQHDLFKDADRTRNPKTGEVVPIASEQKSVNVFPTVSWGRSGIESPQYAEYTGRKGWSK